jgi:polysaccharide export outer membrane protein
LGSSCVSSKKLGYFSDVPDTARRGVTTSVAVYQDVRVQPDDILQISVQTADPRSGEQLGASAALNFGPAVIGTGGPLGLGGTTTGFLVDKDGYIDMPLTGKILVSGMTIADVREAVRIKASQYFKQPVVNVRLANFQITILGEVTRPATYTVASERIDLLQALGLAGDLTAYGKRDNIMLIRQEGQAKRIVRLDLNQSQLLQSPYFYLRPHDVLYVDVNKNKALQTDARQTRTLALVSVLATVTIAISQALR